MKARQNLMEKLLLIVLYVESITFLDRRVMLAISVVMIAVTFHFQGAKPYWPLFFLILILEYF